VIRIVDLNEGAIIKEIVAHGKAIRDIKYSANSESLLTCSEDRSINLIDLYKGNQGKTLICAIILHKLGACYLPLNK